KYFGFMPENMRNQFQDMTSKMQDMYKQMGTQGIAGYEQYKNMMTGMMPVTNGVQLFDGMLSGYNNINNMLQQSTAPIAKMITPNQFTKAAQDWNQIMNSVMVYNIKNSALQYMTYTQGAKVLDALTENILNKVEKGEEINSMMALYQEWMNLSDKQYVALFESDE